MGPRRGWNKLWRRRSSSRTGLFSTPSWRPASCRRHTGGEGGGGKEAVVVKAKKGKAGGILPRKKGRTAIGGDDEDEGEEEDWLESVKKKKSPKKNHSKAQVSGRGMFRQPYSRQEESSIVNYLLEKGGLSLTSGLKLWQDMVEAEVQRLQQQKLTFTWK